MRTHGSIIRLTAGLMALGFAHGGGVPPCQAGARPNIVVVMADDHAVEAISAYGSHLKDYAKTPEIDGLARDGMRFDNFVCANSICSPSRASILTGQYSHMNGVTRLCGKIRDTSPVYPEALQKVGYQTLGVGKWHLSGSVRGYDKYIYLNGQGRYFGPRLTGSEGSWRREGHSTDIITDIALDWQYETVLGSCESQLQTLIEQAGLTREECPTQ